MRQQFRKHIGCLLLLASMVHVLPMKVLHQCPDAHNPSEIQLTCSEQGISLSSLHVKCNLCDFHVPPFIRSLSDFRVATPATLPCFNVQLTIAPELPLLRELAPRAPPLA